MKCPNFFLLGAPKCGTSALHTYLQGHPQLFLPHVKEPHYYLTDVEGYPRVTSEREYASLFQRANDQHIAVGESSVFYLYSREAVPNILRDRPEAKFIAMVRDPVELVYSLHSQCLYGFFESENSFKRAWELQGPRRLGRDLPPLCSSPELLQYGRVAMLGQQVERLLETVPEERVLIVKHEDLQNSPRDVYLRVLNFLGVPDDGRTVFPRVNGNRRHTQPWLSRMLMHPPFPFNQLKSAAKKYLRLQDTRVMAWIYERMQEKLERAPLPRDFQQSLREYFESDQRKLRQLLAPRSRYCA